MMNFAEVFETLCDVYIRISTIPSLHDVDADTQRQLLGYVTVYETVVDRWNGRKQHILRTYTEYSRHGRHGRMVTFCKNGQIHIYNEYKNGKLHGLQIINTPPTITVMHFHDGSMNGEYAEYVNGQKKVSRIYYNGDLITDQENMPKK